MFWNVFNGGEVVKAYRPFRSHLPSSANLIDEIPMKGCSIESNEVIAMSLENISQ